MNSSYWQKTTNKKDYPSINQDMNVDIVIVGGGLTGISLAYRLKDALFNVIVLEKDVIGNGTSGHTTAKITCLHDIIYSDLNDYYGYPYAKMYFDSNKEAMKEIRSIIYKEDIQCDYKENESVLYTNDDLNVLKLKKEKELLESFGVFVKENVIEESLYSISVKNQAIFHPLKYLYRLADISYKKGVRIFEHSKVNKVKKINDYFEMDVNGYKVHCDYVIHATRYPFIYRGFYFMKLLQKREYVQYGLSTKSDSRSLLCIDTPRLSHRQVEKGTIEIGKDTVRNPIKWFAQDSEALRIIPYIGRLNSNYDEFIAFGYRKWGMTLSHVASKIIADEILGIENEYKTLYSLPHPSYSLMKKKIPILCKHVKKGFIDNRKVDDINHLKNNEGAVIKVKNELTAVYKDSNGECYYFSPYCPHLKCIIEFNDKTQTWDCPCHGSTYDAYGHLMLGPSLFHLKKKD